MKEKRPIISLVLPVYKVEKYIHRCLSSVTNQTLMDIEIICVDDGTPDNSCSIIEQFASEDARIRLVHKKNGGLSSARNEGLKHARGEYVWFIDSDDYIVKDACEILYKDILCNAPEMIVFGAYVFPEKYADSWTNYVLSPEPAKYRNTALHEKGYYEEAVKMLFHKPGIMPFAWRLCIKREVLEKNKLVFDETVRFGEDTIFAFDAFPVMKSVDVLWNKLYCYCCYREGSLMFTQTGNQEKKAMANIAIVDVVLKKWTKRFGQAATEREIFNWIIDFVGYDIALLSGETGKAAAQKLLLLLDEYGFCPKNRFMSMERHMRVFHRILKLAK